MRLRIAPPFALALSACAYVGSNLGHALPLPESTGMASRGLLHHGAELSDRGPGFVRGRPREETRGGVARLIHSIEHAAQVVAETHPDSALLRVGDVGYLDGGQHPRHHSHRSGRDVDIMFYVVDATGASVRPDSAHAFSRYGVTFEDGALHFDEARNWTLLRTLLLDPNIDVQWLFVSRGVKSLLLDYALAHEQDPEVLMRAAYVLAQPENAQPHDDHVHVRIYCSPAERAAACVDSGYRWPWLRPSIEENSNASGAALSDDELVRTLLSEDE